MAKIRVYELARDLNMTNKVLLDKIKGMDIDIKSHMSSLDENTVAKIRRGLLGKKPDSIDEKRIKSTVIRRRKKIIKEEPEKVTAVLHPEVEVSPEKVSVPEDIPEAVLIEEAPAEKKVEKRIIPEEAPEKVAPEIKAKEEAPEEIHEPPAITREPEQIVAETPELLQKKLTIPEQKEAAASKAIEPKKIAKKTRKQTAAKIIKLPEIPKKEVPEISVKVPEAEVKKIGAIEKVAPETKIPVKEAEERAIKKKKGKGKKKPLEPEADKPFVKKKASFKRKEVVEGKDLYDLGFGRGRKGRKGTKGKAVKTQKTQITMPKAIKRRIKIDDTIILSELAKRMGIKANEIIQKLMASGIMATVNETIDYDTAAVVAGEFNYEVEKAAFEEDAFLKMEKDAPEALAERPPVVTIMGHVDHGKTSLLDMIRKSRITEFEAGGITQHIGAYHVATDSGQIVFLDTPGHEAFTAMRARGAKVTDIVILVVAADDGVMPQTIEAINHSKAAEVPIIVAINKIDKPDSEPDRVKRELAEHGVIPEDWGGDTIFVNVSAKQNIGIDTLLEMILLQAELLELKANPSKHAHGHIIESKLDSGRGAIATVLVQEGTLRVGDPVVCGIHYGKIRAMLNDSGFHVDEAGPSMPVEVLGLTGVPVAGDEFNALPDEKSAKQISAHRIQRQREKELSKTGRLSLEKLYEKMQEGEVKDLNIIIKADVHGSIEALKDSLTKLSTDEVKINIIHSATGTVTESDVSLAAVSNAIIIGFSVRPSSKITAIALEEHVDMRFYNVIYNAIKEVKDAMVGMMSSTYEEQILGKADVREVFHIPKIGTIAGSSITEGKVERGRQARLLREGVVLYDGKISSLRRFTEDVKEVLTGYECGIGIENYNDIKVGDTIECYFVEEIRPELK